MESNAARQFVQAGLDRRREDRIFHMEDMEAIGVIAGKHDREQMIQRAAEQQRQAQAEEIQRKLAEEEEEARLQEEQYQEKRAECRKDMNKAALVAGVLCGIGGLFLISAWRPEVAMTLGGILQLSAMTVIGLGMIGWRSL